MILYDDRIPIIAKFPINLEAENLIPNESVICEIETDYYKAKLGKTVGGYYQVSWGFIGGMTFFKHFAKIRNARRFYNHQVSVFASDA